MIFLNSLTFIPVFPPKLASAIANKVVGILIKSIPLLKVAAAKPPRSLMTPPPKLINKAFLSAFLSISVCQISVLNFKDFDFSPGLIFII